MKCEVVITRFCEDLSWLERFPANIPVTIYDKSGGGPRQRIHLPGWSSADGPDSAPLWPGAIPLENIGCESHTHMHHIVERWDTLADVTAFLSGDGVGHIADLPEQVISDLKDGFDYVPYGDGYSCDRDGAPNAPGLGPELMTAYHLFFGDKIPDVLYWHGYSMYLVRRNRIRHFTQQQWILAREWCNSKRRSLAMERLYDTMFSWEGTPLVL